MKTARVLWLWIVVAAMCLQGAAAATLLHCAPPPGAGPHSPAATDGVGAHAHHAVAAKHHAPPGHGGGGPLELEDGSRSVEAPAAPDGKCSACASCCVTAALPAPPLLWAVPKAVATRPDSPWHAHATPALPGLERPPRA